jgi:hypothetical protein
MFRQDFTCPALLKDQLVFTHTGLSPAMAGLSRPFCLSPVDHWPVPLSLATTDGISLMSVPPGTEMFQFPGFASYHYGFMIRYPRGWVAPFGYPRIKACSRLPMAFRSVPRPSSPPGAKASTECPYHTPIQWSGFRRRCQMRTTRHQPSTDLNHLRHRTRNHPFLEENGQAPDQFTHTPLNTRCPI